MSISELKVISRLPRNVVDIIVYESINNGLSFSEVLNKEIVIINKTIFRCGYTEELKEHLNAICAAKEMLEHKKHKE